MRTITNMEKDLLIEKEKLSNLTIKHEELEQKKSSDN